MKIIAHHRNARSEIYTTVVYISRENYLSYMLCKTIESNQRSLQNPDKYTGGYHPPDCQRSKISLKPVEIRARFESRLSLRSKTALEEPDSIFACKNMADPHLFSGVLIPKNGATNTAAR